MPEELWLHIASLLSTEEWARASGTCKALQKLQVERVSIKSNLWNGPAATSALLWVARHLHGAKSIVVNGWPVRSAVSKEDFNAICCAMQPSLKASAQPLSLLTVLSVRSGRPQQVRGKVTDPNVGTYLLEILQKAINLSCFNIVCKKVPGLPQMASLKHLSLRVEDTVLSAKRVSEVLLGMPSLETLQLSRHPREPERQEAALVVPVWVQHLELDNVYPCSLKLGSSNTRVALCGALHSLGSALERWSDVRGQIKGLRVSSIEGYERDQNTHGSELWENIEVLQVIIPEDLILYAITDMFLYRLTDANVGCLTSLWVKTGALSIRIPALPLLQDVRILCTDILCIEFDDPVVSAKALCALEVISYAICDFCNFGESFYPDMESLGKRLMKQCCDATSHWGRMSRIFYFGSQVVQSRDPWAVSCGCVGCEGSLGPVVTWGSEGETRKGDCIYDFSEPTEFAGVVFGGGCICSQHDTDSLDESDIYDDDGNDMCFMHSDGSDTDSENNDFYFNTYGY